MLIKLLNIFREKIQVPLTDKWKKNHGGFIRCILVNEDQIIIIIKSFVDCKFII